MTTPARDLVAQRLSVCFKNLMLAADIADAANMCSAANDLRDLAWEVHRVQEATTLRTAHPRRPELRLRF